MITLTSPRITVGLHPQGARIASCVVDGIETCFGTGSEDNLAAGDLYSGVICGRHAGRITNSRFPLDGSAVQLTPNMGEHQLHGGVNGFHARRWDWLQDGNRVTFYLNSIDGEEGFPAISLSRVFMSCAVTRSCTQDRSPHHANLPSATSPITPTGISPVAARCWTTSCRSWVTSYFPLG
jgi:hypothetical protein